MGKWVSGKGFKCSDPLCEENKEIFLILPCTLVLEYPDKVPMGKSFNVCEVEKCGHDPASRLAFCSQVIKIQKFV